MSSRLLGRKNVESLLSTLEYISFFPESGELQVAVHTLSISYYSSNYSDTCIQLELDDEQVAIETALRSYLQTFQSCEENYKCMLKPTTLECNDEDEDGLRTLTIDIITTCPDNIGTYCNGEVEDSNNIHYNNMSC